MWSRFIWLKTVSDQWRRNVIGRRILLNVVSDLNKIGFLNLPHFLRIYSLCAHCNLVMSKLAWTSFGGGDGLCIYIHPFIHSSIHWMLEHGSKGEYVGGLAHPSCPECRAMKLAGWLCWARTSCAQSMTLGSHSVGRTARASERRSERRITRWVSAGRWSVG